MTQQPSLLIICQKTGSTKQTNYLELMLHLLFIYSYDAFIIKDE